MPLDDIAGDMLRGALRLARYIVVDLIVELVLKAPGYVLIKLFRPRATPDDDICGLVGIIFWLLLIAVVVVIQTQLAPA
ncbi:hypothetical protein [Marilutibacter maris]|uniref:hypothetical protein n=1 Tax=Marilutibacter maris TaxID=1605891 RepID=UPI0011AE1A5C|nr:hypothetical protein [Lysobacter maris]